MVVRIFQKQQSQSMGQSFVFPPFPIFNSSSLYIFNPSPDFLLVCSVVPSLIIFSYFFHCFFSSISNCFVISYLLFFFYFFSIFFVFFADLKISSIFIRPDVSSCYFLLFLFFLFFYSIFGYSTICCSAFIFFIFLSFIMLNMLIFVIFHNKLNKFITEERNEFKLSLSPQVYL